MASDLDQAGAAGAAASAAAAELQTALDDRLTRIRPATRWPRFDLRELWHYHELLGIFVWRDLAVRYKQTSIGVVWAIFQPLLMAVVYTVIFGRFAKFDSGGVYYPVFVFAGLLPWQYFSSSLAGGAGCLVSNVNLVTKVYFPRMLLPLAAIVTPVVDFVLGFVVLVGMMIVFDEPPNGLAVLLAPAFLLLAAVDRARARARPLCGQRALSGRAVRDPRLPPGAAVPVRRAVHAHRSARALAVDPRAQPDDDGDRRLALGHDRHARAGPRAGGARCRGRGAAPRRRPRVLPLLRAPVRRHDLMSDIAIRADELAKRYRIGEYHASYGTLRDSLVSAVKRLGKREHRKREHEEIWALDGVSFELEEGEVLGLIGGNGAGKSTLLRILTRITSPTLGTAEIRGRVGSLLEVGTGFHPELTGRENVYLNGAILGMKRREITAKLDEIVEFAGVERFVDTPVKRYSSGMYVRLAFSVAAHLEPEILLVDEVLAVGDAEFQRRCLGRMESFGESGRTVIFVSHNMQTVAQLCDRAILLEHGKVVLDGDSADVVARYLQEGLGSGSNRVWDNVETAPGDDLVRLRWARVVGEDGAPLDAVDVRRRVGVQIAFRVLRHGEPVLPKFKLVDKRGDVAFNVMDTGARWREPTPPGEYVATAWIPGNLLNEGLYSADVAVCSIEAPKLHHHFQERAAVAFHVQDPVEGDSARGIFTGQWRGVVRPLLEWQVEELVGE